jgi:UDP-N-acetylmuramyl pentapeptide phosphotransferase/UDP-N-acetylglucosamine-1-phosphate transferase
MDLYSDVKLTYARDRIVESYFYSFGAFHEENSRIRIIVTKVFVLIGLMDDTYDVRATMEECQMLDEAIQRYVV